MQPEFWFSLPVLTGRAVRLEPLSLEHAAGYLAAAGTGAAADRVFRGSELAPPASVVEAVRQVVAALAARARGERLPYAVLDAASGEFAGTVSFTPDPARRAIGIGHRWLGSRWTGGGRDVETALLLLTYAFDALGAARVSWPVALSDTGARSTVDRLGLTLEGTLHKHRLAADGSLIDTAMYAVTDDGWPRVRGILSTRLDEQLQP